MDKREKRTRRAIRESFMALRAAKGLERITVKELAEAAEISKATFYLHYRDIYDLSDQLQDEAVATILQDIPHPEFILTDQRAFTKELFDAFFLHREEISVLFSGPQESALPLRIEEAVRRTLYALRPELKENLRASILFSYEIQGGYYAYRNHIRYLRDAPVVETIGELCEEASHLLPRFTNAP